MSVQENLQIRVSLVLRFLDVFTNQPVEGASLQVQISGGPRPIRKNGGYFVFTGLSGSTASVWVEGPWYGRQVREVPLRQEQEPVPVQTIRLFPNAACPLPEQTTCAYGQAEPGALLAAYRPDGAYKRLLTNAEKGADSLSLFGQEEEDLEGSVFCLLDAEKTTGELVELAELQEAGRNIYRLRRPLDKAHKKIGARLVPVRWTRADEKGGYFLPLARWEKGEPAYLFWQVKSEWDFLGKPQKKVLVGGARNRLDWRERHE